ncbi:MAG: hypothetical protein IKQ81_03025 [Clostridiales bacterium]|jgi:hypothetical protein|nr:hypothetical protein [Clostridiales bacterium]
MNWNGLIKLGIIVGENIMEKQKIDNERLRQQNEKIARERAAQEASAAASKLQSQRLEETIARESIAVECPNCGFTGNRIRRASTGFCTFCGTAIRVSSEGKAYFVTQEKDTSGQDPVKAQPAPASETPEAPKEEEG